MRNHNSAMRDAFAALPQTVLSSPLGRMVFRVMQRQAMNNNKGNPRRGKK